MLSFFFFFFNVYIKKCSSIIMQKIHMHTHACTHARTHTHTNTLYRLMGVKDNVCQGDVMLDTCHLSHTHTPTVTLTWHTSKYTVHKLHRSYILT